jgi:hypothetical protein
MEAIFPTHVGLNPDKAMEFNPPSLSITIANSLEGDWNHKRDKIMTANEAHLAYLTICCIGD